MHAGKKLISNTTGFHQSKSTISWIIKRSNFNPCLVTEVAIQYINIPLVSHPLTLAVTLARNEVCKWGEV